MKRKPNVSPDEEDLAPEDAFAEAVFARFVTELARLLVRFGVQGAEVEGAVDAAIENAISQIGPIPTDKEERQRTMLRFAFMVANQLKPGQVPMNALNPAEMGMAGLNPLDRAVLAALSAAEAEAPPAGDRILH